MLQVPRIVILPGNILVVRFVLNLAGWLQHESARMKLRDLKFRTTLRHCLRQIQSSAVLAVVLTVAFGGSVSGTVISTDRRIDWIPGVTVGVRGGIPTGRTNLIDVTKAPYNADPTGLSNAANAITAAIAAANSNDVVYLPNGVYNVTAGLALAKSGVTLRGQSLNAILVGHLLMGHSGSGIDKFAVVSGGSKGSTSMTLAGIADRWGYNLTAGQMLEISALFSHTDPVFQYISTAGFDRTLKQLIIVNSVIGNNITFSPPLVFDFTNTAYAAQRTDFQNPIFRPASRIGLENVTMVSARGALSDASVDLIDMETCVDSWITGCVITNANNYCLKLENVTHCEIAHDSLGFVGAGTSHSGLISTETTGSLFQDNLISNVGQIGFMFNDGFCGNACFANFFTNIAAQDIDCHNTHPVMNLWEANVINSFELDGYFGSASHQTLVRNRILGTTGLKRWSSFCNIVGNVLGNTNMNLLYLPADVPNYPRYGIFELGWPNIGNNGFTALSPPVSWNWPGSSFNWTDNRTFATYANGIFTFTNNQINTNVLWGNFTNIPPPIGSIYPIVFQDNLDTNKYWGDPNGGAIVQTSAGTSSNLTLNISISVSNGWTIYVAGQNNYQWLQLTNRYSHLLHGNYVYTNLTGAVVWDLNTADHAIPNSLLYTNGPPSWWGTNAWPAFGPDQNPPSGLIPAQERFLGLQVDNPLRPPPPGNLHVVGP